MMTRPVGFVGGGQMAEALIKGLIQAQTLTPEKIKVVEPVDQRRHYLEETYGVHTVPYLEDFVAEVEVFLLAVKPQVMESVLPPLKNLYTSQLIVSVAAGLPISVYQQQLGNNCPIVRVMPNLGALIQEGVSALCRNDLVNDADLDYATSLFNAVGSVVTVDERLMDAVTGLSGSGPAYVFSFIDAMIDAGVKTGLSRDVARELTIQTVLGAAKCLKGTDIHPAVLRDQVTSPGGTTASGLYQLEAGAFKATIIEAVESACNRSRELGKN
ncbi:MAG: pyrroline-5-carboxylate reductase [Desulfofustis sp.]|nr:pyrroline-5-carboxylate reductase [Desulfofustis sp.]